MYIYDKMDPEVKKEWIKALRSGEYKQGQYKLRPFVDEFCCLGVLCDIIPAGEWRGEEYICVYAEPFTDYGITIGKYAGKLPPFLCKVSGLSILAENQLVAMNDSGASFEEIAEWIEKNL